MATSAFKSTTKRTSIVKSSADGSSSSTNRSSSAHRRSRSLSRFSRPLPAQDVFSEETPRGRFVNKVRGSGFADISLDDLGIEFFDSSGDRGRPASSKGDVRDNGGGVSVRRGRSVTRQEAKGSAGDSSGSGGARVVSGNSNNSNSRRKRSVSVVRYQISDSESDLDHSQNSRNRSSLKNNIGGCSQMPLSHRPSATNRRPALRRSLSQRDLKYNDGYSSQSSVLTDDEGRDHSSRNGIERTIQAVYAQKKVEHPTGDDLNSGLYDAMRKELRHAVEEIRMELEEAMTRTKTNDDCLQSKNFDAVQNVSTIRRNCATKLEQSENRKQDLLAEILLEEQRGRELSKIVKELLPDPNNSVVEKPSRTRKRSNDRSKMSKRLTEEAEKYIEDFISNVEDTDISSLDGERSDTSSTLGGIKRQTFQSPATSKPLPVDMDGVALPWLQWETTNDASPQSLKNKTQPQATPKTKFWDASQESIAQDLSYHSTSSRGSWSPAVTDRSSTNFGQDKDSKGEEPGSYQSQFLPNGTRRLCLDMDKYLKPQNDEDYLLERWRQQERINSGGLLLCNQMFLQP